MVTCNSTVRKKSTKRRVPYLGSAHTHSPPLSISMPPKPKSVPKCLICDKAADLAACSAACKHAPVSCSACMVQHVEARFSAYGLQPVPCIAQTCKVTLQETEVASRMSAEVRARFSERSFNAMMQHEDDFVRCAGGCGCSPPQQLLETWPSKPFSLFDLAGTVLLLNLGRQQTACIAPRARCRLASSARRAAPTPPPAAI